MISIILLAPIRSNTEPKVPREIKVFSGPQYPEGYTTIHNFILEMERLKSRLVTDRIGYNLIIDNRIHEQEATILMIRDFIAVCRNSICRAPESNGANEHIKRANYLMSMHEDNPLFFKWFLSSSIKSLKKYQNDLLAGKADFYINSNNFIELLKNIKVLLETTARESKNVPFFEEDKAFYKMRTTLIYTYYFLSYFQYEPQFQEKLNRKLEGNMYQNLLNDLKVDMSNEPLVILEFLGDYSKMTASVRKLISDIDKMIIQLDKG